MTRRFFVKLLPGLLCVLVAATAWAGGIVISLEGDVPAAQAGTPFTLNFTIRSAHDGSLQEGFTPFVLLTNAQTGETLRFSAAEQDEAGHYAASITVPSAGTWAPTISASPEYPEDFTLELTPLQVAPAGSVLNTAPAANGMTASPALVTLLVAALLAVVLLGSMVVLRRRAEARA
jgi:hypothetical protein